MVISRFGIPIGAFLLAASVAALRPGFSAAAAEKSDTWVQVRSPHFTVVSNGGEKQARHVADQFEQIRAAFQKALSNVRVDPGEQIIILAAKNENTLKALLPEYWAVKGHTHPAGLFVGGPEKNYVAMRLDAEGDNPYHVLYHEYVHLLIRLNFRHLPVWLDEGYAEFFGNTRIGSKELIMGEPSESHIAQLREARLLPLEILLKVDHRSPYYNEVARAVQLDSQSYLAHYYHGRLLVEGSHGTEALAEAEASLRRATALNPNFAPAYFTLSTLFAMREGSLEQALAAASKAVELQPGEAGYSLNLGFVLLRMNRMDEARAVAQRLLAAAGSSQSRDTAQALQEQISRQEQYLSEQKRFEEEARAAREQLQAQVSTESQVNPPARPNQPAESTPAPAPVAGTKPRPYSAFGKITEVSCASPPAMNLTLSLGALVMRLHATNVFKVDYLTTSWKPPANFNPCTHLKGLSAQLSYTLVQGQDYDGEIASVEVRK